MDVDLLLVVAFVAWAVWSGLRGRRQASRSLTDYFLAGRSLRSWQAGFSMTATQYAADTPLLAAGIVATSGVFGLWRLWVYGLAFLLLGLVLGRSWWRAGVVTDAELCELRYGGRAATALRGVKALYYGIVFNCAVLAMVLVAAIRIAEPFLRWHEWLPETLLAPLVALVQAVGVPLAVDPQAPDVWLHTASNLVSVVLLYLFALSYSTTGGLLGVVRTDMGQLALMFVGTAVYAGFAVDAVGGFEALPRRLAETVGDVRARELLAFEPSAAADVGGALLAVLGLQWLVQMNSDGTGYLAQRTMACRSARDAARAPVIFAFAQVLVRSLLWLPIFVALLVLFPLEPGADAATREQTFVQGIELLLPPGARGLLLVGLLAALASTLDTHLNWGASYCAHDLYGRLLCQTALGREPGERELVWAARLANPALVAVALGVMTQLGSIRTAWHATLLLGAGLGVPLLLRWFWRRANAWGELAAIVASGVAAPLLLVGVAGEAWRLLAMAAVGSAAAVLGSLCTPAEDPERLDAFEARVRPPGFWHEPSARRRLGRGLLATAAAAGSLFASLVGLGGWLVGAPPPAWLPYPAAWIALQLGLAGVLVPFWWPLLGARGDDPDAETECARGAG